MSSELHDAAIEYVNDYGWSIFPLVEREKIPAIKGGFKSATDDEDQIQQMWSYKPNLNIGIATGTVSRGLVVIDLDVNPAIGEDGEDTLYKWEKEHGELPETVTAETGSGGRHLYYIADSNIACSVDNEKGVDIRGDGGYVVAPPSIHPNGNPYTWENPPSEFKIAKADDNVYAFIRYIQGQRPQGSKFKLPAKIGSGKRNDTLYKLACSQQAKGDEDDVILAFVSTINKMKCEPPLPDEEVKKIVESALSHEKGSKPKMDKYGGNASLMINESGRPYQTIENATRAVNNDSLLAGRFKYNEIAYTRTVLLPLPWDDGSGERQITDADYCGLAAYLERTYGLMNKSKAIDAVTNVAMQSRYNPITERLSALGWDGTERMDTLLTCYLGCDANDYNIAVMRVFMFGAIARAFHPGIKFDYMPVLIGKQGIGKSMFLRRLAIHGEWFCDNFNTVEGDAATEKLRGMWIVELAELLATKKQRDVESIKAFLTSTVDTIRPKYARETEQRKRMCVFCGTTNDSSFLTDSTGNRRFLPVECGIHEPILDLFADDVDEYFKQAWAEAVHKYKTGKPSLVLDERLQNYAIEYQNAYTEDDPRIGEIEYYLEQRIEAFNNKPQQDPMKIRVCAQELINEALSDIYKKVSARLLVNEVHRIMQNKIDGWVKYPSNNGRAKCGEYGFQRCYIPANFAKEYYQK